MKAVTTVRAIAAPLDRSNVDTDQLTPARFMGSIGTRGNMAAILFHDLRHDGNGAERPDFVLNQSEFRDARILVAGANFGCGSSRETAVWALMDAGFEAVIAPSFGDIFHTNCAKNGLIAIRLPANECAALRQSLREQPGTELTVDLQALTVSVHDGRNTAIDFGFDPFQRTCLMQGLDDIGITKTYDHLIREHEARHTETLPWLSKR